MATMDPKRVVQVNDLTVRFKTPDRVVEAVRNVSFHVDRGETLAIVGESGSGKSVTSLALMRLVEYGGGRIVNGGMQLRRRNGEEAPIELRERMTMSDPEATCEVAAMGLGITLVCMQHAYAYLESGALVRVLPDWYVDAGNTSLYYAANKLLPAKTRVFVDFVVDYFRRQDLARRFSAFPTG